MVSHRYRCIFIHIPKAAGTSIETAMGHFEGHSGRQGQDHRSVRVLLGPPRRPSAYLSGANLREVARHVRQRVRRPANPNNAVWPTADQYREYFKFTVVRNPWARAYSWYLNVTRDPAHQRALGVRGNLGFEDFLARFVGHGPLRPQLYWLQDYDGNVPMDYVCRFESLQADFDEVCRRIGVEAITLPHALKGGSTSYVDAYDEPCRRLVAHTYADEIALFNYAFEDERGVNMERGEGTS